MTSQVQSHIRGGCRYAVDADLSIPLVSGIDRVNHDVLMSRAARRVRDKQVLRLIGTCLRAGIGADDGTIMPAREGVPQGGPLSPLPANIVLDELDRELVINEKKSKVAPCNQCSFLGFESESVLETGPDSGHTERYDESVACRERPDLDPYENISIKYHGSAPREAGPFPFPRTVPIRAC